MTKANDPELKFWSYTEKEVYDHTSSGPSGLNHDEAVRRLKFYGPNSVRDNSKASALSLLNEIANDVSERLRTAIDNLNRIPPEKKTNV